MRRGFSIGDAVAAPFRLAFGKPLSTIAWGLVLLIPSVVAIAAVAPLFAEAMQTGDAAVLASEGDLEDFESFSQFMAFQAWSGLSNILGLLATLLVTTAVIRAAMAGRRGDGAAFLRFSRDEFHVAVIGIAIVVGTVIVWIVLGVLIAGFGIAGGVSGGEMTWSALTAVAIGLIGLFATLVLWGRLSLIAPAAVITKTLAFDEGWRAGRGQTAKLFLLMLTLFAVTILIGMVVFVLILIAAVALGAGMAQFDDPSAWDDEAINAWVLAQMENPWPMLGVGALMLPVLAWISGFSQALWTAPFAVAAQGLVPRPELAGADVETANP
ncbi:hypothetical protein IP78_10610 [Brevundimonas sp. AAP58]|uniref:hypothetical protein n=1 Tax=Brevundimonas sp. AAP58 TaxID=1523422 RepID=UPI0006B9A69E|nr:hypothetical protein [Brevundimonas sp. AAP58]KPF78780.1 hypothetical protein IP78_10610 [Brevundimonas sp. AAP58]